MLAGITYASTGDSEQAESSLKKAVEVDPANLAAYSKLANLYLAQGRLDDAVNDYEDIAKRRPELAAGANHDDRRYLRASGQAARGEESV